ncbi:MAG: hypothetical protein QW102_01725 [Candidatus Nezhaarchaeales archaeon]
MKKIFGSEPSIEQGKRLLAFLNLRFLAIAMRGPLTHRQKG